ncbi:hypothetical protein C8A01DRAFT_46945 [Parachaetomium inaequale]|uniref:Uncharacterized protein n=1 Tax=Parachaetomium inaequale TaxID=2588326 RepID=A0AAN6PGK1_9PEZI|nr:hypothetical protein C8A01DRAFT_46945 [Parachaetomium inaequale]
MASPPRQGWQQERQQVPEHRETGPRGAHLDSAVGVQLIAKTGRLSISGPGSKVEDRDSPLGTNPAETTCCSRPIAQPCAATTEEWREDTPAATPPATAALVMLTSAPCSPMAATRAGSQAVDEELEAVDTSHHLRTLSLTPHIHATRLRRTRTLLPPLLTSPARPSRADLIRRSIVLTHTTFASRRLARSLASIRLARNLASRPSAETLVERCVLPAECLPPSSSSSSFCSKRGVVAVAPGLVARKRAVEKERVKDGLRGWVGSVWKGEVGRREEGVRRWEERAGVGRVWRLRRFWERVGKGEV